MLSQDLMYSLTTSPSRQGDVSVNQIHGNIPLFFIGAVGKQVDGSLIKVLVCYYEVNLVLPDVYAAR